jgi:hypothetical protein
LAWPSRHPAHRALHGIEPGTIQKVLAHLTMARPAHFGPDFNPRLWPKCGLAWWWFN